MRALVFRHEALRALWGTIAALGVLAIVLPLAGLVIAGGSRTTAMAVLGTGGLVAILLLIAAFIIGWIVPRRRFAKDAELARWIGTRHRPIASDLLSAVELAAAPERKGAPSAELVDALVESTEMRLDGIDPKSLVPPREVPVARNYALGAIAVNLLFIAVLPVRSGWRHLLFAPTDPFEGAEQSNVPLVGDLTATLTAPAYSKRKPLELPSSSGDLRGLPGTTVSLRARVLAPAVSADLVIEQGTAPPKMIAAKLDGDQLTAQLVIDQSAKYRFELTSTSGTRSIEMTPRTIEAEPDQAPAVTLMTPGEPLDVSNLRRVELAYVIEDDFGVASAELVWESGKDKGRRPIQPNMEPAGPAPAGGIDESTTRLQGKLMWDIAELQVPSGGDVRYWIEAKDNDSVGGPNIGRSREYHLRVISPRERHEETLERQQQVAEKLVKNLGARLVGPGDDAREEVSHQLRDAIAELASIGTAFDKDPHASEQLRKALASMHDRLDRLSMMEQKLLPKTGAKAPAGRYAGVDARMIGELEDDTIALADWLDRERMEGLLDITDEINAHQKRLADLMAQYARTKDPRVLDEIEREMRAVQRLEGELEKHRQGMPEDVLDQYVNRDAMQETNKCMDEVAELMHAGKVAQAQAKLAVCQQQQESRANALEGSLSSLRGDKFGDEQKKLDEVMNELSDVTKDQDDIAAEANRLFESYAAKADEVARDHRREAAKKVGALVDKLKHRLDAINESGLTPFAKEEMDIVDRRLADVEHMVADGDLAEGLAMAKQAKQSIDTIGGELEAALSDDPKSKWADATQDALDGVERAEPAAKDLIDELEALSPKPDQIMSADDQRAMDRLRRRQQMNEQRAKKLGDRTKQMGSDLPGDSADELGKKLGTAVDEMGKADERMKGRDPSGARESAKAAAEALAKARDRARSAARQAQQNSVSDEPIRIPGADEYKTPERYREDVLDGMRKGKTPGYETQQERYKEEILR